MDKKILFLVLILLFSVTYVYAENLTGRVIDGESNKPLGAANVLLIESNKLVPTDENGYFLLKGIETGKYRLKVTYIGYETKEISLLVPYSGELVVMLNPKAIMGREIVVSATRAQWRETPVVFTNITREGIKDKNYGQDIPMLLDEVPNVFSYSESGNGFGYTYLKVRGFDTKRVGVMINDIPLNDPEDHQVYWVDMPDFAENTSDIQLQRGVGSSMYGVSTFGGALNVLTNSFAVPQGSEIYVNYGSFNTARAGAKLAYEIYKNYKLNLRYSKVLSDGYRDKSQTEMWSYFSGLSRRGEKSLTEVNIYGGNELTHAAWYASPMAELEKNHQHNPVTYKNEIDDFSQPHFEIHQTNFLSDKLNVKNTLFYIRGKGYYEQYKSGRDLWEYGLADSEGIYSDLVRQKHVEKNHYGWIGKFNMEHPLGELTFGSYISLFDSKHWGEVDKLIDSDIAVDPNFKYYEYTGDKSYVTFYVNELFKIMPDLTVMANLYYQKINYKFQQKEAGNFKGDYLNSYQVDYNFFNPRLGTNYNLNENINFYGNISMAQREPTDDELYDIWDGPDYLGKAPLFKKSKVKEDGSIEWSDAIVKSEKLMDYELGAGYSAEYIDAKVNLFLMDFQNEIVGYGAVNEDGSPIRGNAESTIHRGLELSLTNRLPYDFTFSGTFAYNDNYFDKFKPYNWEGTTDDLSGNKIAGFPDILANVKLTYTNFGFIISGQLQHVGKQYLDNTQDDKRIIDPYQVVNAYIVYRLENISNFADVELNFRVNNLLDKKYYTAGYYDDWEGEKFLWPAAERNFMMGIRLGF